ncbi:6415_t:CDS:2 [Gigaspora margarita]|uniref:6415_t:CDS:1 n=1 Tax=Gigaspora margarita TaxID=4874 RepID=A0ABN7VYS1_GIGMA|nr:6415_t:CDS:2 [Gigaspora margarita]
MSSELELLRQRVTKPETENTKLKQIIKEIANARNENTRLKQIIKQNRTTNDASQIPILSHINGHSDENGSTDSLNLEQVQSDISPKINSNNTPKQVENTSDDASYPDICQESKNQCFTSPIYMKPKSLEDKAVDDFLDLQNKEIVSNMMRERNREKKFQDQESIQKTSAKSEQMSTDQTHNTISPKIKIPYDQKVERGLMHELSVCAKENLTIQEINVQIPDLPLKKILIDSDEVMAQIIKLLSKEKRKEVINKLTMHFTDSPKLDLYFSVDKEGEHQSDAYWVLGPGIPLDEVLKAYPENAVPNQPIVWNHTLKFPDKSIAVEA